MQFDIAAQDAHRRRFHEMAKALGNLPGPPQHTMDPSPPGRYNPTQVDIALFNALKEIPFNVLKQLVNDRWASSRDNCNASTTAPYSNQASPNGKPAGTLRRGDIDEAFIFSEQGRRASQEYLFTLDEVRRASRIPELIIEIDSSLTAYSKIAYDRPCCMYYDPCVKPMRDVIRARFIRQDEKDPILQDQAFFERHAVRLFQEVTREKQYKYIGNYYIHWAGQFMPKNLWNDGVSQRIKGIFIQRFLDTEPFSLTGDSAWLAAGMIYARGGSIPYVTLLPAKIATSESNKATMQLHYTQSAPVIVSDLLQYPGCDAPIQRPGALAQDTRAVERLSPSSLGNAMPTRQSASLKQFGPLVGVLDQRPSASIEHETARVRHLGAEERFQRVTQEPRPFSTFRYEEVPAQQPIAPTQVQSTQAVDPCLFSFSENGFPVQQSSTSASEETFQPQARQVTYGGAYYPNYEELLLGNVFLHNPHDPPAFGCDGILESQRNFSSFLSTGFDQMMGHSDYDLETTNYTGGRDTSYFNGLVPTGLGLEIPSDALQASTASQRFSSGNHPGRQRGPSFG